MKNSIFSQCSMSNFTIFIVACYNFISYSVFLIFFIVLVYHNVLYHFRNIHKVIINSFCEILEFMHVNITVDMSVICEVCFTKYNDKNLKMYKKNLSSWDLLKKYFFYSNNLLKSFYLTLNIWCTAYIINDLLVKQRPLIEVYVLK